jgi:hypothetical protein
MALAGWRGGIFFSPYTATLQNGTTQTPVNLQFIPRSVVMNYPI